MARKSGSWFWWVMGVCAVGIVIALVCRSGGPPDRADKSMRQDGRVSFPEQMRVSGTVRTDDHVSGNAAGDGCVASIESMTLAVEHGTASLATSSGEFPLVEYVDGPVLFQDGFEHGAAKWGAKVLRGPEEGHVLDESETVGPESAKVEERDVHGTRSAAVVMEWRRAGSCLVITPSVPVSAEAFSFEADTYIESDSGMNCLITSAGRSETIYHDAKYTRDPRRWGRVRVETVRRMDGESLPYYETKFSVDGQLISHRHHYSNQAIPGFVLERGTAIIDNVVIRRMVPKGTD